MIGILCYQLLTKWHRLLRHDNPDKVVDSLLRLPLCAAMRGSVLYSTKAKKIYH